MPIFDSLKIPKIKIEVHDPEYPDAAIQQKRNQILGYPTIYFYNKLTKQFVEYTKARQAQDLMRFFHEHAKPLVKKRKQSLRTKRSRVTRAKRVNRTTRRRH